MLGRAVKTYMKSGTGILPVGLGGIGILPMMHGLEAHATLGPVFIYVLRSTPDERPNDWR
jgi:hypothetical protein